MKTGKEISKRQHWKTRNKLVTTTSNYENIVYSSRAHHQNVEENNIKLTQENLATSLVICLQLSESTDAAGKPFTN